MRFLKLTPVPLAILSAAALVACGSDADDAVVDTPRDDAGLETVVTTPTPEPFEAETLLEDAYPTVDTVRGNAVFVEPAQRMAGRPMAGVVEDDNAERFATAILFDGELQSGNYDLTADVMQRPGVAERAMIRVATMDEAIAFDQVDIGFNDDGSTWRYTGGMDGYRIADVDGDGFRRMELDFTVDQPGRYRVLFYPAVGMDGRLNAAAMGRAAVGGVSLRRTGN